MSDGGSYIDHVPAEWILTGEWDDRTKTNLKRHPGTLVRFSEDIFRCKCGYVRSKEVMKIYKEEHPSSSGPGEKEVWNNAKCRCSRCKRSMRITEDFPKRMRCKCGSWTEKYMLTGWVD